jgi:hypothetical protein
MWLDEKSIIVCENCYGCDDTKGLCLLSDTNCSLCGGNICMIHQALTQTENEIIHFNKQNCKAIKEGNKYGITGSGHQNK